MKIAVTYEAGLVFQHFGHTSKFKIYEVENGEVTESRIVDTMGQGHGALAGFLLSNKVDTLICGGIGMGARNALASAGIKLYGGVSGECDETVELYLAGDLNYNPDVKCNHHGEGHGESHTCGGNCGNH